MTTTLYDDGCVRLDDEGITIPRYYFPTAQPRRIAYADVRGVDVRQMGWLTGRGRLWGTASPNVWLPLDVWRWRKDRLVIIDLGRRVRPCISPDDPDLVRRSIAERISPPRRS